MEIMTENASFVTLKEKVRHSIAVTTPMFDSHDTSSIDVTLNTIRALMDEYDKKSIVRELNRYQAELDCVLNYEAGSMDAAEMMQVDRERRQNCQAALQYLNNKGSSRTFAQ